MKYKVSRDPIYSEIFIYPLEMLVTDTKPVQRLRFLSQLAGAAFVYPGASHTRFAHSMGTMHVTGMYAEHLFKDNRSKQRILRLAGLLHDIGHGPFSHQFDDVVYPMAGINEGHDEYRDRILLELMPEHTYEVFKNLPKDSLRNFVLEDLEATVGNVSDVKEALKKVFEMVVEVFHGEETGSVEFNIIQGPLGADRIDFILRDSYNSGTRTFGTGAPDRIIRNSLIAKKEGRDVLCYNAKVMDDIYAALFGRFMMYKNVYFHKTSRAADLMIQEILKYSYKPLGLKERILDLEEFINLTDSTIIEEVKFLKKTGQTEFKEDIDKAYEVLERLLKRDLWKVVVEMPFSIEGIDPGLVSKSLAMETLEKMKKNLKLVLSGKFDEEDYDTLKEMYENFDDIFIIDTPYKLTLVHPDEFVQSKVLIYKDDKVMNFEEYVKKYPAYRLMSNNLIQILRIYIKKDYRNILEKYQILPSESSRLVTRW
ncbi:MAG: HD domain-containing protein [Thermotogaceae bacterium]|nr:HD domain-containing protein [Thermotogaceae bacterium]